MQVAFTAICLAITISLLRKAWVAETTIRKLKLAFTAGIMAYFTAGFAVYPNPIQQKHIDYVDGQFLETVRIFERLINSGER